MERNRILIAVNITPEITELKRALVAEGYEVKITDNGTSALRMCREFKPQLIVAEQTLSKIDGHHLLRELKSQSATKTTPFVLMSSHRSVDERVHSIELGADDYITIPFEVEEVLLRLQIIIKEAELVDDNSKNHFRGFSGKLRDMNLIELIQTLEIAHKSAILKVQNSGTEGILLIKEGKIIDAILSDLKPEHALLRMITWDNGTFKVEFKNVDQINVFKQPTAALIAMGLAYRRKWEKIVMQLPPLQTVIRPLPGASNKKCSEGERNLLGKLNGHTRIADLIGQDSSDDVATLGVLAKLFDHGLVVEGPAIDNEDEETILSNPETRTANQSRHLANLITTFVQSPQQSTVERRYDRRKSDRRATQERRSRPRRSADFVNDQNPTCLNKSELIMIREKLSGRTSRSRLVDA